MEHSDRPESTARPTLSIVVLNHNYGRYLSACVESILEQTFRDFELVIIDDCSSDDSLQVAERFTADPRVRLHRNPVNQGFAKSLICGTEQLTSAEFVTVISADDIVRSSNAFAIQIALLRGNPNAVFCFSAFELLKGEQVVGAHQSFSKETTLDAAAGLKALITHGGVWPLHSGTILRRAVYRACGGYRRDLKMAIDLALWLTLAMEGGFVYSPESLYGYRIHDAQMSVALTGFRTNAREVGMLLRDACSVGERRGLLEANLVRHAIGLHLANTAISDAFSGRRGVALRRILAALLECPREAVTSKKLWVIGLCVATGAQATLRTQALFRRTTQALSKLSSAFGPRLGGADG